MFKKTPDHKVPPSFSEQIAFRIGLIDKSIDQDALGEFVMYLVGQPHRTHTTYEAGLQIDENAQAFLNKFGSK